LTETSLLTTTLYRCKKENTKYWPWKGESMKKLLFIILISLVAFPAYAADVGVSVSVGQPGFYGHIDIGNAPPPQVIYPQPIVVRPAPAQVVEEPIYLRVPPGHAKNWKKHCAKYNACGRPVYFVKDKWYHDVYVPHYRAHKEEYDRRGHGHGKGRGHGDRHDRDRDDKGGHGKGHYKD
jgi:hypothetical protein